jgi:hypothetical protein
VWLTRLPVSATNVEAIAQKRGRGRWKIENEGFNRQKNSGLNLRHVYRIDPEKWKAYCHLLQIAFVVVPLLERGSLLRRLAQQQGKLAAVALFGSLKNSARRLLESLRQRCWPTASYDAAGAATLHIGLEDTSWRQGFPVSPVLPVQRKSKECPGESAPGARSKRNTSPTTTLSRSEQTAVPHS